MRRLLKAIETVYRQAPDGPLAAAAQKLSAEPRPGTGKRKPVAQFVARAVELARQGPFAEIAEAFAAIEPQSDWLQNPNYSVASLGPGYLDRYGYVELVGPGRPVESTDVLVGLLLLGPGMHYPDHAHPAEEIYHVIGGTADWWREDEGWRRKGPGTLIRHAPMVRHAMRTADEPLLSLYCWIGDVKTYARMTEASE